MSEDEIRKLRFEISEIRATLNLFHQRLHSFEMKILKHLEASK